MDTTEEIDQKPVWLVLIIILLSVFIGLTIGAFVGQLTSWLITTKDFSGSFIEKTDYSKTDLLIIQGVISIFGMVIFPLIAWNKLGRSKTKIFFKKGLLPLSVLLTVFITVAFMAAISVVIEWNQNIHLPDFLKPLEDWARLKENELAQATKEITQIDSVGYFVLALVVVGAVAAVTEEFLFRGIIQTELSRGTKNIHLAIWVSAFIFSAFHVQFFGFVPRLMLGALFGYLYAWSGNLLIPILGHFVNNGAQVVAIYLSHLGIVEMDIENPEAASLPAVVFFAAVCAALLYYFKRYHSTQNQLQA